MGFEKFGMKSFTSDAKVAPFIDHLEQGRIMTTKCRECGKVFFPPKADCPRCLTSNVEWVEINGNGTLLTYTVVNYGPSGFENDTPYILGIAEFEEGVKILGRVSKEINPRDINVGMKIKLVPVKLANGQVIYEMKI
ncbi:MAG: Zn-ribbon domain-containing OB-fold protein [Chloroflexi bacterium]|nr:Zn-ribbon domain-containing OB-fold protein [Chloroflexota bacterium]